MINSKSSNRHNPKRAAIDYWVQVLVLKIFLWKATLFDNGGQLPITRDYLDSSFERVPKKEVRAFLEKLLPKHLKPGDEATTPNGKVRHIQHLTKNSEKCLRIQT